MIGEVEIAFGIEHEIVRALERLAVAVAIDRRDLAGERHALNLTADVVVGLRTWRQHRLTGQRHRMPREATVLRHVDRPIRPEGGAVRPAAGLGDHALGAIARRCA